MLKDGTKGNTAAANEIDVHDLPIGGGILGDEGRFGASVVLGTGLFAMGYLGLL